MPLEQEVPVMLQVGFYGIVFIFFLSILILQRRYKDVKLTSFLVFIGLFTFAGFNLLRAINIGRRDVPDVMQSEEASMSIGVAGVFWAISMFFLINGIYQFIKRSTENQKDKN